MSRKCPHCREPFRENAALHVEVPYLAGPDDRTVWYCIEAGQHVHIPRTWVEGVRESTARLRRLVRTLRRWS